MTRRAPVATLGLSRKHYRLAVWQSIRTRQIVIRLRSAAAVGALLSEAEAIARDVSQEAGRPLPGRLPDFTPSVYRSPEGDES